MQISLNCSQCRSVGKYFKNIYNKTVNRRVTTPQVGDYLDISSLRKSANPENYECKTFIEFLRQIRRYKKAFGVNWFNIFKGNSYHHANTIPAGVFENAIHSVKRIASIKIKTRSKKIVDASIDKIDLGGSHQCHECYYVLKRNNKQIAYINAEFEPNNRVHIAYLTNILGRKKYRGTEQILVQTVVEDCIKKGFVPRLEAVAENVGRHMGRGYNNMLLYKKMGMHPYNAANPEYLSIDAKDIIPILKKYLARNGEILPGTKNRLELLEKN